MEYGMIRPRKVIEEYDCVTDGPLKNQKAVITFVDDKFQEARFFFSGVYSYSEWMFLREVANLIEAIKKQKEGDD